MQNYEEREQIPLYVKVYKELLKRIMDKEFYKKLPSENKLADMLNVSRTTLRQALLILQEDNIIIKKHGSGTYINHNIKKQESKSLEEYFSFKDYFLEFNKELEIINLKVTIEEADTLTAKYLDIAEGVSVVVIERCYFLKEEVYAYALDILSGELFEDNIFSKLKNKKDFLKLVEEKIPAGVQYAKTSMIATHAGKYISRKMRIVEKTPLLLLVQTLFSLEGDKIALNKTYTNTSKMNLTINRKAHS